MNANHKTRLQWFIAVVIASFLGFYCSPISADESAGTISAPGRFVVPAPAEGFKWSKLKDVGDAGRKSTIYSAEKEGVSDFITLSIMHGNAQADDKGRTEHGKAAIEGVLISLKESFQEIKADPIDFKAPVPDVVYWNVLAKTKEGKSVYLRVAVVYCKKDLLVFTSIADSAKEANRLTSIANDVKRAG